MKSKFLTLLCNFLVLFSVNAHAFTLQDATSFDPIPVQVQAASIGVPVGTVIVWTQEEIPEGWLECNGQFVPDIYPDLKALMPNVPDYRDRFLQGVSSSYKLGEKIEAGLPNITGTLIADPGKINHYGDLFSHKSHGAFQVKDETYWVGGPASDLRMSGVSRFAEFNASYSNSLYGNSQTVQPPSITVKYLIKAK